MAAGIFHGMAGPEGVLGVVPAVQLRDTQLAATYLSVFCLTSTFVMAGFAAFYATLARWMAFGGQGPSGNRVYLVETGSACLSFGVGIIWLTLLWAGELKQVFDVPVEA